MCWHQRDYRWSSYLGNAGLGTDRLLFPHEAYLRLGLSNAGI